MIVRCPFLCFVLCVCVTPSSPAFWFRIVKLMTCQVSEEGLLFFLHMCVSCAQWWVLRACVCVSANAHLHMSSVVYMHSYLECAKAVLRRWRKPREPCLALCLPFWHKALPINYWHFPIASFPSHLSLSLPLTLISTLKKGISTCFLSQSHTQLINSREEAFWLKLCTLLQFDWASQHRNLTTYMPPANEPTSFHDFIFINLSPFQSLLPSFLILKTETALPSGCKSK